MESALTHPASETFSATWRLILRGLLAGLGAWRLEPTLSVVAYGRISGIFGRIERMLVRFRAGRLWRVVQKDGVRSRCCRVAGRGPALPRRFGWLVIAGKHQAMGFGLQVQTVLNTPDMVELLAASPQARRILQPLCRALAVEVPGVSEPPRTRDDGERPKPPRKPRPKPEPFKIPLPRGVLSWARREGFGKLC